MNNRPSMCRSERKSRLPQIKVSLAGRCSLQNENNLKRRRSSSLDYHARVSGSASKPRSSSEERKSLLFPVRSMNRKSSINVDGGKAVKEVRPLSDKAYQKKKICELVEFLGDSGYPHNLSIDKFQPPSRKDCENIFNHLMQLIEPSLEMRKFEEDAPKALKLLQYPFIPNKSAFMYVARTNWPPLLGALLFLMDAAKFAHYLDDKTFYANSDAERPEEQQILAEFTYESYTNQDECSEDYERAVFEKIIRSRNNYNIPELESLKEMLSRELEDMQKQIDELEALKHESEILDDRIQQYEAYFLNMKQHKKKKEESCQQLEKDIAEKESQLSSLQTVLSQKQALYDAQGFDGKKELTYFEAQKKELLGRVEEKRADYRALQDACGEAEIQLRQAMDKGAGVVETFNSLYTTTAESAQNAFLPLKAIQDPQITSMCNNYRLDFPECGLLPAQNATAQQSNVHKATLEETKKTLDSAVPFFKGMLATQNQKLHQLLMEKSELAVNLKMLASEESQKERDLSAKEKQAREGIQREEIELDKMIQKFNSIQAQVIEWENRVEENKKELIKAEQIEKDRKAKYLGYVNSQREAISKWQKDLEDLKKTFEANGERIVTAVEEAVNRTKK